MRWGIAFSSLYSEVNYYIRLMLPDVTIHEHCTENENHIFPVMKLCGLVPNFYVIYILPQLVLFGLSIVLYCLREHLAQLQERREGQGTATKQRLATVPCPPLRYCGWAEISHKWLTYKFPIWKITDNKWKQWRPIVKLLFDLRMIKILSKTFILDSYLPFIAVNDNIFCTFDIFSSVKINKVSWILFTCYTNWMRADAKSWWKLAF